MCEFHVYEGKGRNVKPSGARLRPLSPVCTDHIISPPARKPNEPLLVVEIMEAKPNKMYAEEERQTIRFLRHNHSVECASCKKKRRVMWTMLCEFEVPEEYAFRLQPSGIVLAPLTPVCQDHVLMPGDGARVVASHNFIIIGAAPTEGKPSVASGEQSET